MKTRHSIDLETNVAMAYDLFRQVEDLPRLLPAILEVTPEEPNGVRYRVAIGDERESLHFDADLVDATPNRRLAWNLGGSIASAALSFTPLGALRTRLDVELTRASSAGEAVEPAFLEVAAQMEMLARALVDLTRARSNAAESEAA